VSASDVIARLRELNEARSPGPWRDTDGEHVHTGNRVVVSKLYPSPVSPLLSFAPWCDYSPHDAAAIVAAMNSLPALLECAEAVQKIHDHLSDYIDARKTVDVSVAVAFETSRAALQALAEGGGE
jgi:hypothetical protein